MIPAPTELVPMILCPHACPIPGSASYSAKKATVFPLVPFEYTASKDVSNPPTPLVTLNSFSSNKSHNAFCDLYSSNANSGFENK